MIFLSELLKNLEFPKKTRASSETHTKGECFLVVGVGCYTDPICLFKNYLSAHKYANKFNFGEPFLETKKYQNWQKKALDLS